MALGVGKEGVGGAGVVAVQAVGALQVVVGSPQVGAGVQLARIPGQEGRAAAVALLAAGLVGGVVAVHTAHQAGGVHVPGAVQAGLAVQVQQRVGHAAGVEDCAGLPAAALGVHPPFRGGLQVALRQGEGRAPAAGAVASQALLVGGRPQGVAHVQQAALGVVGGPVGRQAGGRVAGQAVHQGAAAQVQVVAADEAAIVAGQAAEGAAGGQAAVAHQTALGVQHLEGRMEVGLGGGARQRQRQRQRGGQDKAARHGFLPPVWAGSPA
jgi:hypothetical protein